MSQTFMQALATHILDACSVLAYLRQETGATVVSQLISSTSSICAIHAINFCEVYYDFVRRDDITKAQQAIEDVRAAGIEIRRDIDDAFWQMVGDLKVNPGKLSLADCFALALAIRDRATLVTSDNHEFDAIVPLGLCPILFIR